MSQQPRYLTKSRFKLALECPSKLYYTRKLQYENNSDANSFLEGLAQGGFQVEELARMYYPGGIAVLGDDYNYDLLVSRTKDLLKEDNVTIFEPALLVEGLFIRVDILVKRGDSIRLIEVKAKSISGSGHESFISSKGKLVSSWVSYLYDIAFQKYVMQLAYPEWNISAFLQLVNKDATTSVNGLHQCFKVVADSNLRTGVEVKNGLTREDLGDPILCEINVDPEVNLILGNNPVDETRSFSGMVNYFLKQYQTDTKIFMEIGNHCRGCEFRVSDAAEGNLSGFHECWEAQLNLSREEIDRPKVFDVWYNPLGKLLAEGKYFMKDLTENDLEVKSLPTGLSRSHRQWLQIEKVLENDNTPYFDLENLKAELDSWKFPLNFIDFETSAVAIPFMAGMRPYEQLAFQFSHHIVYEDGRVDHHNEYLNTEPGVFPNFDFIRALKKSLEVNVGSIFRYHNHENTIVNVIYDQLRRSDEPDKQELMDFIESISHNTGKNAKKWDGPRDMIDLQKTVVNFYYDPVTGGSNSIKDILPAVLGSSTYLQEKYRQPLASMNLTSKNFGHDHIFLKMEDGKPVSPYKALPPVFDNWDSDQLEKITASIPEIADGGAALFAYGKLQFPDVGEEERAAMNNGLLRYCELDTLAMVMIYEYFREICFGKNLRGGLEPRVKRQESG